MADTEKLPSFRMPPVVETVLGVQFERVEGFTNAHLGLFWAELESQKSNEQLRDDWDAVTDMTAIEPSFERFSDAGGWGLLGPRLRLSHDASTRLQIRNRAQTRMIQVQNGRLHLNWLRKGQNEYARYARLLPVFDNLLGVFSAFVRNRGFGALQINQWEVTYVNHLLKGREWNQPGDWPALFAASPAIGVFPDGVSLETMNAAWHFEIVPQRGRLHIELHHVRVEDAAGPEALRVVLTARGPASDEESLRNGLDLGRRSIVTAFDRLTTPVAQAHWGRE